MNLPQRESKNCIQPQMNTDETQIAGHSASDICENLCSSVAKIPLVLTF